MSGQPLQEQKTSPKTSDSSDTDKSFYDLRIRPAIKTMENGLRSIWEHHKFRTLAPIILLLLLTLLPMPTANSASLTNITITVTSSFLPNLTVWLLANMTAVVMSGVALFLAGYLLYQFGTLFRPHVMEHKIAIYLGWGLMWSAVGFGLGVALFTPAVPTFLQMVVIGDGVTGLISQLLAAKFLIVASIVLGGFLVGVFLASQSNKIFVKEAYAWRAYVAGRIGVALVYSALFAAILYPALHLSVFLLGLHTGMALAFSLVVGSVLAKAVGHNGQLIGWIGAYADMLANQLMLTKSMAVDVVANASARATLAVEGVVPSNADLNEKGNYDAALKTKMTDNRKQLIENGPTSRVGKLSLAVFNAVKNVLSFVLYGASLFLGEINKGFEALEGKLPYGSSSARDPNAHETRDYYDPILAKSSALKDDVIAWSATQKAIAKFNSQYRAQLVELPVGLRKSADAGPSDGKRAEAPLVIEPTALPMIGVN